MLKAVLFDMDGTLGDTLALCIAAFRMSIEPLSGKKVTDEEIKATFGPSEEATVRAFLPDRFDEGLAAYLRHYDELHGMCPDPFPGIRELLTFLKEKGLVLGVVTGKGPKSAALTFARYGMEGLFSDIETGDPYRIGKTDGIRRILARHELRPDEAVYVGDAPSDIVCAREAGVGMYAVTYASTTNAEELIALRPDEAFHSVDEMRAHFEKILGTSLQ